MRKASFALAAALSVLILSLSGCGSDDQETSATGTDPAAGENHATCDYSASGTAAKEVTPPAADASVADSVAAVIKTNVGDLKVDLDGKGATCTVNSFLSLAKQGYFDGTPCHRLTTAGIFVLQCGDPTGTGTGGPGYTVPDEYDDSESYPAGTLAMANTGQPNSGGSQFFLVYQDTPLPPAYTVFGHVDAAAVKLLQGVAAKGVANGSGDGAPKQKVTLESVTVG